MKRASLLRRDRIYSPIYVSGDYFAMLLGLRITNLLAVLQAHPHELVDDVVTVKGRSGVGSLGLDEEEVALVLGVQRLLELKVTIIITRLISRLRVGEEE